MLYDLIHQLAAGGFFFIQTGLMGEKLLGRVVVDGQVHPVYIFHSIVWKQGAGGDIHRNHRFGLIARPGQQSLQIGGKKGGSLWIFQHIGLLPNPAQSPAQAGGTADGIPVGTQVGQDQKVIAGH